MQLDYDGATNTLRLTPSGEFTDTVMRQVESQGIIDIADGGRLAGIEITGIDASDVERWHRATVSLADDGSAYFVISVGDDRHVRSVSVDVLLEFGSSAELVGVAIPRRGEGYEISYPSGNQ